MTARDGHRFFLDIDDGYVSLRVVCPYDKTDTDRPCWPTTEESDYTEPVPGPPHAPLPGCNYESWVENLGVDEIAQGSVSLELDGAWLDWSNGDYPIVQLAPDPACMAADTP